MQRRHFRPIISLFTLGCSGLSLMGLLSACTQVQPLKPDLTIQVQPSGADGYAVSGTTNLPGKTRVLVQAIRKLVPTPNAAVKRAPTYAIVAQQWVDAVDGNWQATLKLRQSGANGALLESWQQNQPEFLTSTMAAQQVTFIASTTPIRRDLRLEGDTEVATSTNQRSEVLQIAVDGNRYLKVQQALTIAPPPLPSKGAASLTQAAIVVKASPATEGGDQKKQEKTDAALRQNAYVR
jgi:hypothetical protein